MLMKLRLRMIAIEIEWHWQFIKAGRKRGLHIIDDLVKADQQLISQKLMRLTRHVNRHCTQVTKLSQRYKNLAFPDLNPKFAEECSSII